MDDIKKHYDVLAKVRDQFFQKNSYYYSLLIKEYRYFIPENKKVLEVGCGTGELLNALNPAKGFGVDLSPAMIKIAREKFSHIVFHDGEIASLNTEEKFDYIVLSGLIGELEDIQKFFEGLRRFCHRDTRMIIEYYSCFWQYLFKLAEKLQWKIPQKIQNWITHDDLKNFLTLSGYDVVKKERCILFPKNIPGLSYLLNRFIAKFPVINALTLTHFMIARVNLPLEKEYSVSIVIPCRNERGNIEQVITRTPVFGRTQEFIFVEGHSQDQTYEEVQKIIKKYPQKNIQLLRQTGQGKGDALRLGFARAQGDIFMILDADLTVMPEDLPKFYEALCRDKGEFVNGCRLVYPLEQESMRFLNLIANKTFGLFFSWLLGQRFKDTLCGTKVLFKRHYEAIVENRAYFGDFDPFGDFDLIFGASKLNLKILELPIRYQSRSYGETQIQRFRHGLLLLRMCFFAMRKIKFR